LERTIAKVVADPNGDVAHTLPKLQDLTVVGSCMMDLVTTVPRMPKMGETLVGHSFKMGFGGKGANQAVMAARLGASVSMIARVGVDDFGTNTINNFKNEGVEASQVRRLANADTGTAPIIVAEGGQNIVLIVPGANLLLKPEDLEESSEAIESARVVLCQLEIRQDAVLEAFKRAKAAGATTILNPAPAAPLKPEVLALADYVIPNETELEVLTEMDASSKEVILAGAKKLCIRDGQVVIVTLGDKGSLVWDGRAAAWIETDVVNAVDTTGAGDAFIGSFATLIARGFDLHRAVLVANRIAAISVQNAGTQTSFPNQAELKSRGIVIEG
jgi:ribokinase